MKISKWMHRFLALALALCMAAGYFALPVNAEEEQGTFNYVSIGASNTNGYGMRGYITEEELALVMSGEASKDDINVYGYERTPEGAYPDLIRDYYAAQYGEENVNVNQLAISSMRVEEVRILLDETYMGDDYSQWRFTGDDGWFRSAEEGGIDALRVAYAEKIGNADLVTVDIGWNNFGVYVCNQLVGYMSSGTYKWTTDINTIYETEAEREAAAEAKAIIAGYIQENVGEGDLANALTDIFAYSILGYMHNFDIVMEKIYELNPDANVVVIGIQNLLYGVSVDLNGEIFPLGEIFGNFVNMANYYASACSPWQSRYQYVKVGEDEHVTIFLDAMKDYDGDAEHLNQNVKDCYDYYDNDLFIQTRVDYMAAEVIKQMVAEELGEDMLDTALSVLGCKDWNEVVAKGKAGELPTLMGTDYQEVFDEKYWPALYAAYDTLSVMVKEIANTDTVDANGLLSGTLDIGAVEDQLIADLEDEIVENAMATVNGEEYTVEIPGILPEKDANTVVVAAMYVRYYMGNSFFAHPNEDGHAEILDAVVHVINNPETEKDQALSEHLVESVHEMHQLICGATGHDVVDGVCTICGYADGFENPFVDVKEEYYFYEPVMWAVENGITTGADETHFEPLETCIRGQVVTFLWRAAGEPAPVSGENPFVDVGEEYYRDAVMWAAENGITTGADATHFDPGAPCTRGQVVTFLWRFAGEPKPESNENPFVDVGEEYYRDAIVWAVENGITTGTDATHFEPGEICTRGQIVTFLYRFYNN